MNHREGTRMKYDRRPRGLSWLLVSLGLLFFVAMSGSTPSASPRPAEEILADAIDANYPHVYEMTIEMRTVKPGRADRVYKMHIFKKGTDKSLMEILAPSSDKGQKILRVGNNLWMFLPDVNKSIRVGAKDRLLGGDFTTNDVMRVDIVKDYVVRIGGEEAVAGRKAYRLELKARDPSVAYDRVLYWVTTSTPTLALKCEFYTLSGKLMKTMAFRDVHFLEGRDRPTTFEMVDTLKAGSRTMMYVRDLKKREDLADSIFTQMSLHR